jgi:hypothetical protein
VKKAEKKRISSLDGGFPLGMGEPNCRGACLCMDMVCCLFSVLSMDETEAEGLNVGLQWSSGCLGFPPFRSIDGPTGRGKLIQQSDQTGSHKQKFAVASLKPFFRVFCC